jgi:hypothetical protein
LNHGHGIGQELATVSPNWKNVVAAALECPFGDLSFVK